MVSGNKGREPAKGLLQNKNPIKTQQVGNYGLHPKIPRLPARQNQRRTRRICDNPLVKAGKHQQTRLRKRAITMAKRTEHQRAKTAAWNACSRYIRLRDAIATTKTKTHAKCCTCTTTRLITEMDAGHFISGRKNANLFDERGIHSQCKCCNGDRGGNWPEYYDFMAIKYGENVIQELIQQNRTIMQLKIHQLKDIENHFNQKYTELDHEIIRPY
ncbi:MAG: hypothetical protein GY820_38590 [Gammaproteobacteria bacterium]|nr:hypothetical protein [Gammaproteobacteria bacterium]